MFQEQLGKPWQNYQYQWDLRVLLRLNVVQSAWSMIVKCTEKMAMGPALLQSSGTCVMEKSSLMNYQEIELKCLRGRWMIMEKTCVRTKVFNYFIYLSSFIFCPKIILLLSLNCFFVFFNNTQKLNYLLTDLFSHYVGWWISFCNISWDHQEGWN